MQRKSINELIMASVALFILVVLCVLVYVADKSSSERVPAAEVEKPDTRRFVEIRVLRTSVSHAVLIRDTATGREYLITTRGGIIEIPSVPATP